MINPEKVKIKIKIIGKKVQGKKYTININKYKIFHNYFIEPTGIVLYFSLDLTSNIILTMCRKYYMEVDTCHCINIVLKCYK